MENKSQGYYSGSQLGFEVVLLSNLYAHDCLSIFDGGSFTFMFVISRSHLVSLNFLYIFILM